MAMGVPRIPLQHSGLAPGADGHGQVGVAGGDQPERQHGHHHVLVVAQRVAGTSNEPADVPTTTKEDDREGEGEYRAFGFRQ